MKCPKCGMRFLREDRYAPWALIFECGTEITDDGCKVKRSSKCFENELAAEHDRYVTLALAYAKMLGSQRAKDARNAELEERLATVDKDLRGALWYMHRQYHATAQMEINKLMRKLEGGAS